MTTEQEAPGKEARHSAQLYSRQEHHRRVGSGGAALDPEASLAVILASFHLPTSPQPTHHSPTLPHLLIYLGLPSPSSSPHPFTLPTPSHSLHFTIHLPPPPPPPNSKLLPHQRLFPTPPSLQYSQMFVLYTLQKNCSPSLLAFSLPRSRSRNHVCCSMDTHPCWMSMITM
ncbi:glutelin-2-like isoform X2 [Micropterus dolomieu]|uniref:glutelin-2-like isoform X2 n=1 Tax=Micropterus dolomieu TaxID=147949 RepID=UPI001E8ED23E|nr:glutelin-2-like isoform X2 [Micropterus dolomieu]